MVLYQALLSRGLPYQQTLDGKALGGQTAGVYVIRWADFYTGKQAQNNGEQRIAIGALQQVISG